MPCAGDDVMRRHDDTRVQLRGETALLQEGSGRFAVRLFGRHAQNIKWYLFSIICGFIKEA